MAQMHVNGKSSLLTLLLFIGIWFVVFLNFGVTITSGQTTVSGGAKNCTVQAMPDFSLVDPSKTNLLKEFYEKFLTGCLHTARDLEKTSTYPQENGVDVPHPTEHMPGHRVQVCYIGKSNGVNVGESGTPYEYFRVITKSPGDPAELYNVCDFGAALWNHQQRSGPGPGVKPLDIVYTKKFLFRPLRQDPLDEIDSTEMEGTPDGKELYTALFDKQDPSKNEQYEYNINTDIHKWSMKHSVINPRIVLYKPVDPEVEPISEILPPWRIVESTLDYSVLCEKYKEIEAA